MNYKKIYDQIVERANSENRRKSKGSYYESHHIVPKCMGGGNEKENLVLLTAREHLLVHWMLCRIYPENSKLSYAFLTMCAGGNDNQERYKPSGRVYAEARELYSKNIGDTRKGENNPMFGRTGDKSPMFGRKGDKNPMYGKGYLISGEKHGMYGKGYLIAGEKHPMFGKTGDKNPASKKVKQYSKDGKSLIKIYGGIAEAAREVGTYGSDISKCCKGNQKSAGGYKWEYVLEEQVN